MYKGYNELLEYALKLDTVKCKDANNYPYNELPFKYVKNKSGNTPLMYGMKKNDYDCV